MGFWRRYVPVAERREQAEKSVKKLQKKGKKILPVELTSKTISTSFWGKGWCSHLESFSDYENRLPRGRTYVRNGSVCHLDIQLGHIEALVIGSSLYDVSIKIDKLNPSIWAKIKKKCAGQISSLLELLQGKISKEVMAVVTDEQEGLFPKEKEISFSCSCPDWAGMCKHVAAVFYGVANRLDHSPELLFLLRGVNVDELILTEMTLQTDTSAPTLSDAQLGNLFDIELEDTDHSKTKDVPLTGAGVAALRKKLGFSVPEFAKQIKAAPATIYRWEAFPGELKLQKRHSDALLSIWTSYK